MKKLSMSIILLFCISTEVYAKITVAVVPLKGNDSKKEDIYKKIKSQLHQLGGLSILANDMMKSIMKMHKKSQLFGSDKLDITKIKVAEYIIGGTMNNGKLSIKAISVNTGSEIYGEFVSITRGNVNYNVYYLCKKLADKILLHASSKKRDIPSDAEPYFNVLVKFKNSLAGPFQNSYPYLAFYHISKYKHPKKSNPTLANQANIFIRVLKRKLIRAKLTYVTMKQKNNVIYVTVVSKKFGKKTKHKFGMVELDDGSLGIISHRKD